MHAFDINSIEGKNITVRKAEKDEKITTLDEQERQLDDSMLVIADDKKDICNKFEKTMLINLLLELK